MWSHLSKEDLEESTKQLPATKRQEILSLIAEIQRWNQVKDEVDAGPSKTAYLPPVQIDPGDDQRASRASSHPYNVAFESDDASISVDGKKSRRDNAGTNFTGVLAALVDREDSNDLQKILDDWYRGLRQALLTANAAAHERLISGLNRSMQDLMKREQQESDRLHSDIDSLHTLCRSYSRAIHQRDQTIANLSQALASQKEQTVLAQNFSAMKTEATDRRREAIQERLATSFYQKKLAQKIWLGWRSAQREDWKQRTEKACQQRAEEVCHKMADQYDSRIAELEEIIRKLREDNNRLREERDRVNVKARGALLRGVSVLKDEAEQFPANRIPSEGGGSGPGSRKESKDAVSGSDASDRTVQSRSGQDSDDREEEAKPVRSRHSSQARSSGSQNSRKPSNSSNRPSSKNDSPRAS
ncbi:hypothetical protein RvY_04785 [Ramazzottius varieornatus]|uniref:Centrosomal protein POC5 n=1 Tax=Ramazzottius varieornatus TaxID=947166 RepID=A0A1D1UYF6_RAMVA|nr:hypothetical protein RvY_04785 [Ramazzottius varieornatus]